MSKLTFGLLALGTLGIGSSLVYGTYHLGLLGN